MSVESFPAFDGRDSDGGGAVHLKGKRVIKACVRERESGLKIGEGVS